MNTKNIPALVMLLAGAIASLIMLTKGLSNIQFLCTLLIVLIVFYVLGTVIKVILDRNIGEMKKDEETVEGEDDLDENKENIDTTAAGDGEANPESAEEEGFSPEESGDEGE